MPRGGGQRLVTLPALRHEVQTLSRLGVTPASPTRARTRWMLGFQRRLVRRWECEMLCPKLGPLPQTSQLAATGYSLGWFDDGRFRGPDPEGHGGHVEPVKSSRGNRAGPKRVGQSV